MKKYYLYAPLLLLVIFVVSCGGGGGGGGTTPPATTGTATLTWTAPTTNADTTPLTNLAGFKIYYGTTSGYYPQSINVGATTTTYQVANLPKGATYYFVVRAYNTAGVESDPSVEGSKAIN